MDKKKVFDKILEDIKAVRIQGARNIAKKALYAYELFPKKSSINKLISLRPTEPMLVNVLHKAEKEGYETILEHFNFAQERINESIFKLLKNDEIIFTHCHSTNVVSSLIYSKKKGKNFQVYNTETRPLLQGRKTAKELEEAGIKVTMFIDSAVGDALGKEKGRKKVSKIFLGADALVEEGIINKIGSEVIARLAREEKIPVYIVADSWKFSKKWIPIENRKLNEVWDKAPKQIKLKNPAFEFVPKKYLKGVITELGLMKYDKFVRKMMK